MTDLPLAPPRHAIDTVRAGLRRRAGRETRLRAYGLAAIAVAALALLLVFGSLIATGWRAFTQTHVTLDVFVDPAEISVDRLPRGGFEDVLRVALADAVGGVDEGDLRALGDMLSDGAQWALRDMVVADNSLIGQTVRLSVPLSDPYDQLAKGLVDRDTAETQRRVTDQEVGWFDALSDTGAVRQKLNTALVTNNDSRFPELAGLRGAIVGSLWVLGICFLVAFPVGIGAAIYLEEFAPKSRGSDLIEVNINNLAAVPSVVFGLLALAVFINWFGLPRGAPIVGGLTLALMSLPTIIIATRTALKAVPPSIREAAMGVGASRQQVVFHHVLPLAMPGVMTGTILALANAIGETAPLLLIGMNAFVTTAAETPFQSSTVLPTQIFLWADSPERGFVSRTSAAILVLLAILILMNGIAVFLRNRFERRW